MGVVQSLKFVRMAFMWKLNISGSDRYLADSGLLPRSHLCPWNRTVKLQGFDLLRKGYKGKPNASQNL